MILKFYTDKKEIAPKIMGAINLNLNKTVGHTAKVQNNSLCASDLQKKSCIITLALVTTPKKPRKTPYRKPEAVKILEQMADNEQQRKHPNTPPKYLVKSKYRDDTANGLTKCIVDFIRLKGGQAERINTTGIPHDTRQEVTDILGHKRTIGSLTWRTGNTMKGSADISATIRGRSVKIEVKIGKDRQSEAQRQYQAAIEAAGGLYYVAKDFTTFAQWYGQQFEEGGAR